MTVDIALPHGPAPTRVGQGTEIEKSRAASEVYYRVLLAREMPRDVDAAAVEMRRACAHPRLAEKAFYAVPKGDGGGTANGASVHLARELARIWGNLDYGVHELRRDDEYGQSEIQAFAWDLQTNARPSQIFIQPHKRDLKGGRSKRLTSNQDIYESNASAGARRLRECIFAVLPKWFVEEAKALCRATLEAGDGTSIEERRARAIEAFGSKFGVTEEQLVDRLGRSVSRWDEQDVADLQVLYRSLAAGEVHKETEFPDSVVQADEIAAAASAARARRGGTRKAEKPPEAPAQPGPEVPADDDEAAMLAEQIAMEAEIAAAEQAAADDPAGAE